jgi:hypothetical protein
MAARKSRSAEKQAMIGYIVSIGRDGLSGFIQAEGNYPVDASPDWWANPNLGRYSYNSNTIFTVGQRVVFDADGSLAVNTRPA